uniref:Uncharacterized protein n=1 Tax=Oryctolagus cuniculus TaxID=9986 RepID=A0A5F9CUA3_RABIT
MGEKRVSWQGDLACGSTISSTAPCESLGCFPYSAQRTGVGADLSLVRAQLGPSPEPSQLLLSPHLETSYFQKLELKGERCRHVSLWHSSLTPPSPPTLFYLGGLCGGGEPMPQTSIVQDSLSFQA